MDFNLVEIFELFATAQKKITYYCIYFSRRWTASKPHDYPRERRFCSLRMCVNMTRIVRYKTRWKVWNARQNGWQSDEASVWGLATAWTVNSLIRRRCFRGRWIHAQFDRYWPNKPFLQTAYAESEEWLLSHGVRGTRERKTEHGRPYMDSIRPW